MIHNHNYTSFGNDIIIKQYSFLQEIGIIKLQMFLAKQKIKSNIH